MKCIVRTRLSGVWVLAERIPIPDDHPFRDMPGVFMITGRRLWSWEGGGELTRVAQDGCPTQRLAPRTEVLLRWDDVAEVLEMSDTAVASLDPLPEWRGGD